MTISFLTTKQWDYVLLGFALLIFSLNQLPFLTDMRPVMYDEPWYMNPACNMVQGDGLVNTVVGSGGNANFVAPMLMAGMMSLFGCSLTVARITAVILGFLAIFILHLIMNTMQCGKRSRILGYALFLSITIVNSLFRYVRPEFAAIFFVLVGVLFFLRYQQQPSWWNAIGLSISIYLSGCSHPYALYLFAWIGIVLLVEYHP